MSFLALVVTLMGWNDEPGMFNMIKVIGASGESQSHSRTYQIISNQSVLELKKSILCKTCILKLPKVKSLVNFLYDALIKRNDFPFVYSPNGLAEINCLIWVFQIKSLVSFSAQTSIKM